MLLKPILIFACLLLPALQLKLKTKAKLLNLALDAFKPTEGTTLCKFGCINVTDSITNLPCSTGTSFMPWSVASYKGRIFMAGPGFLQKCTSLVEVFPDPEAVGVCEVVKYPNETILPSIPPCNLYTVYDIKVDSCCHRLWVLDSGTNADLVVVCDPKLLVIDLETDTVTGAYLIPKEILPCKYELQSLEVNVINGDCDSVFVYVGDQFGFELIIFDYKCGRANASDPSCWWSSYSKQYFPDPSYSLFTIDGHDTYYMAGVHSLALGSQQGNEDPYLYFHSLSENKDCRINTSFLNDPDNQVPLLPSTYSLNETSCVEKRATQSSGHVITADGIMFLSLVGQHSIACWDIEGESKWPFFKEVVKNKYLRYPIKLAIEKDDRCYKTNNDNDTLYILSSDFFDLRSHQYFLGCNRVNTVLLSVPIANLTGICSGIK